MQASHAYRPAALGEAVKFASRQVWLASLGAAVVTRDWANKEAGKVFGTLVREGTVVESRAIRFVGNRVEHSVARANAIIGRARSTLQDTVTAFAAKRAPKPAKRAASVKRARTVKRAKAAKRG